MPSPDSPHGALIAVEGNALIIGHTTEREVRDGGREGERGREGRGGEWERERGRGISCISSMARGNSATDTWPEDVTGGVVF